MSAGGVSSLHSQGGNESVVLCQPLSINSEEGISGKPHWSLLLAIVLILTCNTLYK
jgi:hypothetical protein